MNLNDVDLYISLINDAQTIDEIDNIVAMAQAESDENDEKETSAQALQNAKDDAKSSLNGLNLKEDEKLDFVSQIEQAKSIKEINEILVKAQETSDANDEKETSTQALEKAKNEAIAKVKELNLNDVDSYIAQINSAQSIDEVNAIVQSAINEDKKNNENENAAQALYEYKMNAIDRLNNELNLDAYEISQFRLSILAATTYAEIDSIMAEAQKVSDQNDESQAAVEALEKAQHGAVAKLAGMNLTDAELLDYTNQLYRTLSYDEIDAILAMAQQTSDENDLAENAAKELAEAKTKAYETIKALGLGADEATYLAMVDAAQTILDVNAAVDQAKQAAENKPEPEMTVDEMIAAAQEYVSSKIDQSKDMMNWLTWIGKAYDITDKASYDQFMKEFNEYIGQSEMTEEEQAAYLNAKLTELLNEYRVSQGLGILKNDDILFEASMIRAKELKDEFSHHRPDGSTAASAVKEVESKYSESSKFVSYGEIIVAFTQQSKSLDEAAQHAFESWKASEAHNWSMLFENDNAVSFGFYKDGDRWYFQAFLGQTK